MSTDMRRENRYALIFGSGTLFSRVLGLARDAVLARVIPTGSLDAFWFAFRFPNMLRDLVGEGASNAAFVPVFSASLQKDSREEFRRLVAAAMSAMMIVLLLLTALGILAVPLFPQSLSLLKPLTGTPAHTEGHIELMSSLSRWTFPYLFFIGMAVFMMGALFSVGHYMTPSWSPALLNVSLIVCCLLFYRSFPDPAYALVTGVLLGGVSQLAVQYFAFGRHTGVWWPSFNLRHPGVWTIFGLMLPVLVGQAAGEVNKFVDIMFAGALPKGTVTALFYANRLVQLPLSIFGLATSVAILPTLSRLAEREEFAEVRATLMHAFRQTYFLLLPSMLGLVVLSLPVVRLLYGFEGDQADRTAMAAIIYGLGLVSFGGIKVAVSGFYAVKNTKTPVMIASASMILNILLNATLVRWLEYRGLAIATTISFTVNFVLLYLLLCERYGALWNRDFLMAMARITLAGLMMAAFAFGVRVWCERHLGGNVLACVAFPIGIAVVTYGALGAAMDIPELRFVLQALKRRRARK